MCIRDSLYYGEKIGEENLSGLIFCTEMGFAGNPEEAGINRKYSLDALPQEIPGSGVGDFRDDMIDIRHADGSFAADFRFDSFEILDHSYACLLYTSLHKCPHSSVLR